MLSSQHKKISSDRAIGISVTPSSVLWIGFLLAVVSVALVVIGAIAKWGSYWLQAYFANADVSFASLIAMTLLGLDLKTIVNAKVMGRQAGLRIDHGSGGMTTQRLQAHALAGGNVDKVVTSLVVANGAGLVFDFDTAAAIDLAGRDVLAAIQARVFPKVIRCPLASGTTRTTLSGVSKDGVELRVSVCVTVRTNMEKLIGGATEETIIARIGERIVANIGASEKHTDILALPSLISSGSRANELSENTIFDIVSIDVGIVSVGTNIGARLAIDQAEADINSLCTFPGTGLIMAAVEQYRVQAFYVPSLGPAPKWCSFLDNLTEELEESKQGATIYEDYKFVTRDELTQLNLTDLIGSNLLRPYMHGFFIDIRLYNKVLDALFV